MKKRITKDQYYMNITREVAGRTPCFRAHHGAIIVSDDQIIATGYNGAPRKTKDCYERGNCLRSELKIPSGQRYELCRSVHSEQNALINAARAGVSVLGGTLFLYSKIFDKDGNEKIINAYPCFICKKMLVNSGIKNVKCNQEDGSIKEYFIEDWVKDWQENDLIDDVEQYGTKIIKNK
ncbi:MAG: Cytidine/deoxycytidylate deaminase family protein [Candidatus Moranbacteria bacterium GW2011_GWF1_36_4]|nr:MAG: Cytidine/deoxycytidylate deaminase family protein [Candidatus Moranbacteria bacterium GW2011_GWF1_36_4]HBO16464.1 hypothetical protein [Candidatus Moranbacteria bacterium]